jgi:hypothetical protein
MKAITYELFTLYGIRGGQGGSVEVSSEYFGLPYQFSFQQSKLIHHPGLVQ